MSKQDAQPDHWTASTYNSAAAFVPALTSKVLSYLSQSPSDHILDIGCGDGTLTAQIAASVPSGRVVGLDSSANFITHAKATYSPTVHPNLTFGLQDCSDLNSFAKQNTNSFDKVFSNAAFHWILREPTVRGPVMKAIFDVLKPGGRFVFEMGGAGNVAEVHAALLGALVRSGVNVEEARAASPWFFPSDVLMGQLLSSAGFEVDKVELEYRPTRMEEGKGGGVRGWVELMGATFLDKIEEGKRSNVVDEICEVLKEICTREEGGEWLGYVRCRAIATKPV